MNIDESTRQKLMDEGRKCRQLGNEKLEEFENAIKVNKMWLQSYVDQLLKQQQLQNHQLQKSFTVGVQSSATGADVSMMNTEGGDEVKKRQQVEQSRGLELSQILKTPATVKRKVVEAMAEELRHEDASNTFDAHLSSRPSGNSEITSFMQKLKEKVQTSISSKLAASLAGLQQQQSHHPQSQQSESNNIMRNNDAQKVIKDDSTAMKQATSGKNVAAAVVKSPPKRVKVEDTRQTPLRANPIKDQQEQTTHDQLHKREIRVEDRKTSVKSDETLKPVSTDINEIPNTETPPASAVRSETITVKSSNDPVQKQQEAPVPAKPVSKLPILKLVPSNTQHKYQFTKPHGSPAKQNQQQPQIKKLHLAASKDDQERKLKLEKIQKAAEYKPDPPVKQLSVQSTAVPIDSTSLPQSTVTVVNMIKGNTHIPEEIQSASSSFSEVDIPSIPSETDYSSDEEDDYSDEEGGGRANTSKFDIPDWAKSPNLKQSLRRQKTLRAESIFGQINPLKLEEIFQGSNSKRFRVRSSSANWTHDKLTEAEAATYDKFMGIPNINNISNNCS